MVNRPFRSQKCCQNFVSSRDKTLSVAAMRIRNPDCSPLKSIVETLLQQRPGTLLEERKKQLVLPACATQQSGPAWLWTRSLHRRVKRQLP
jgi:hypothetical protein